MGHPAVWRGFDATYAEGAKFRDVCGAAGDGCWWRWVVWAGVVLLSCEWRELRVGLGWCEGE
jgi:hypothetical protein